MVEGVQRVAPWMAASESTAVASDVSALLMELLESPSGWAEAAGTYSRLGLLLMGLMRLVLRYKPADADAAAAARVAVLECIAAASRWARQRGAETQLLVPALELQALLAQCSDWLVCRAGSQTVLAATKADADTQIPSSTCRCGQAAACWYLQLSSAVHNGRVTRRWPAGLASHLAQYLTTVRRGCSTQSEQRDAFVLLLRTAMLMTELGGGVAAEAVQTAKQELLAVLRAASSFYPLLLRQVTNDGADGHLLVLLNEAVVLLLRLALAPKVNCKDRGSQV